MLRSLGSELRANGLDMSVKLITRLFIELKFMNVVRNLSNKLVHLAWLHIG